MKEKKLKMFNIETILLFVLIFSVLAVVRTASMFIRALLQDNPQRFLLSNRELIFLGLTISYIITFIIKN